MTAAQKLEALNKKLDEAMTRFNKGLGTYADVLAVVAAYTWEGTPA